MGSKMATSDKNPVLHQHQIRFSGNTYLEVILTQIMLNTKSFQETTKKELAGYVKGKGNLKVVLVHNAGHSVPMDQPQWALRMVDAFIRNDLG